MAMHGKHTMCEDARTKEQSPHKDWGALIFVVAVMVALSLPFVCMPFAPTNDEAELQELAVWPKLSDDGAINVDYLSEAGAYFDDHFAFRQQIITANAHLFAQGLETSPTSQVVVGSDGWLYYAGTMADYQRTALLSDRAIDNAAFNVSLMQRYAQEQGAQFLLMVAPNKNSLYSQNMPYYELAGTGPGNAERLQLAFDDYGVNTLNLFDLLGADERVLYMKTDTHWNTEGARIAYDAALNALDIEHDDYLNAAVTWDDSFVGDLEAMLYLVGRTPEAVEVYEAAQRFSYTNEATSVQDADIATASQSEQAQGSLVMYRDSFGNALLPFFATQFKQASFTKLEPYNAVVIAEQQADVVIVERAERHLEFFATNPPILPAQEVDNVGVDYAVETTSTVTAEVNGPYIKISGVLDEVYVPNNSAIYVGVESDDGQVRYYEACRQSVVGEDGQSIENDYGYLARVVADDIPESSFTMHIVVAGETSSCEVASMTYEGV